MTEENHEEQEEHEAGKDVKKSDSSRSRTTIRKDKLSKLKDKAEHADEYLDNLLRLRAEFANFKRRSEKERQRWALCGEEELVKELLPVLDNLERAIEAARQAGTEGPLLDGIAMIYDQTLEVLKKRGIKRIESVGKEFDPNVHEAVGQVCTDDVPNNHVIDEMQAGYRFHDRLLRPAMVRVAKTCH
ncbi:nucleotide exchange factor GrpE [bacterium]|nr:nucleotide exchange factor GrpE [bacterium]